jgi:hypothetical protein
MLITIGTALLTTASTVGVAKAGDEFLIVNDLPADPTWISEGIHKGEPAIEEFCVGDVIEPAGTRYQGYHTDLDASAREHIITSVTETQAARLQRHLNRAVRGCAEAYEQANPGSTAIFKRYDKFGIADGVAVYGVFTEHEGSLSANLFAVGRDSIDVAVVRYGRIGRESDVPVHQFQRTARRSVTLLVP